MESINHLKGYGKVNPETLENPEPPKPQKRISSAVAISAVICLTLVITLAIAALIHESTTESSDESQPQSLSNSAESTIKTVCNVTRYPDSCFRSISALNRSPNPDPEAIFKLSLEISAAEISRLLALFKTVNSDPATQDCVSQLEEAISRVNDSASAMRVDPGEKALTGDKVKDIQTWISSAVTDQETCLDGLEEMGSTAVEAVKSEMNKSKEYSSNSLAIVANFKGILDKFNIPLH
ncbi:pectinesterase 1-like [Malus sylvestris]|uniref:pectinesterase 1-like n=1 Tax=Malus sylvestris TaxID=3752 RepID=UPI0021AD0840|nr:pectinesterase 1-like [Malus sylvestris]